MSTRKDWLSPATRFRLQPHVNEANQRLDLVVIMTTVKATIPVMKIASSLADGLNPHIWLLAFQVVPYPLPLEQPPFPPSFSERNLRRIATESHVESTFRLYLCRDRWQALTTILNPRSLVLIGTERNWWPTGEQRLARRLRFAGHRAILV